MTAWSLPMVYRVQAWTVGALPGGLTPVARVEAVAPSAPARASCAYAFKAGSEASIRMLAGLLRDSVRVWYAPNSFVANGHAFPDGAFVVRVVSNRDDVHEVVARHITASGTDVKALSSAGVSEGTDLGSNSVIPVRMPQVALLGGPPVNGSSFGFSWYAMDQRIGYPTALVDANFVASGDLSQFNVLIMPGVNGGALERILGDAGRARLAEWVRNGGVLITLDAASSWVAQERVGLVRTRVKRDSARADSAGGAPLPSGLPGVLARATIDTLSPLLAGVNETEIAVFANGDRVLTVPRDLRAGEAVIRFAPASRVRLSGYFWPESAGRLAGSPYLWTERVGRGRVIVFAQDEVYRDQLRGMLAVFANAVLLGGSY